MIAKMSAPDVTAYAERVGAAIVLSTLATSSSIADGTVDTQLLASSYATLDALNTNDDLQLKTVSTRITAAFLH